jgi:maleate isomerase
MTQAIGSILPSSNRTVERTTAAILRCFPALDACYGRITYYGAGIGQPEHGYDTEEFRRVAWQLSHAKVGVITWNGTKGAGHGLDTDRALCAEMSAAAGCPATTAALDTWRILRRLGARRLGILTPGSAAYAEAAAAGLGGKLVAVRSLGLTDNFASSEVPAERIMAMVRALAREGASKGGLEAILLWSTNLPGWTTMASLEAELGIPVIDSTAAGVWGCLDILGIDPRPAAALGRIFTLGT